MLGLTSLVNNNHVENNLRETLVYVFSGLLTLKMPRKPASENVVCLCRLLNILAKFTNLLLHRGKQCGPRSEQSDLCPHCLQK